MTEPPEKELITYLIGRIDADDRATRERTQTKDFIFVEYEIYNYVYKILDHSLYLDFRDKNRVNRGKYISSEESSSHPKFHLKFMNKTQSSLGQLLGYDDAQP